MRGRSADPISVNCWPSSGNDGTCDVNIEYELENAGITIHDLIISIPLPSDFFTSMLSYLIFAFTAPAHTRRFHHLQMTGP